MPAIFFYGHYDLLKRWLSCMRLTFAPMVFVITATILHILLCTLFVKYFDYGIHSLAISNTIKDFSLLSMTVIYSYWSDTASRALLPMDVEALRGWKEYLGIAIPATIMICCMWWASEMISVLSGLLGVVELASIIIV